MSEQMKKQFADLKEVARLVRPDSAWKETNKNKLLRQIQNTTTAEKQSSSVFTFLDFWFPRSKFLAPFKVMLVLFIIVGMTAGSWIAGVSASTNSLPGEVLYNVKIAAESTQLALTSALSSGPTKAQNKAKLQLQFAERRSKEVKKLVAQKKPEAEAHVPPTIKKLKKTMQDAQDNLKEVKQENPKSVLNLAKDVTEKTTAIAQDLKEVTEQSPAQNSEIVKEVVATSKIVNDTGLQAIEVVLEDKKVMAATSQAEIKELVQEKVDLLVKNIEANKVAVEEVKQLSATATSTLETQVASTTIPFGPLESKQKTVTSSLESTIIEMKKAGENIQKADKVVIEVKELLADNQVKEAIEKAKTLNDLTTETQQSLVESKNKVNTATATLMSTTTVPINTNK